MSQNDTRKLFGTDGIRGVANQDPMTAEVALRLGRAVARRFQHPARPGRIVIGKDTRLSGYMLESALQAGIVSAGADVMLVGPLPTPGIAFITWSMRADAGVVISASHNPYQDNGIKVFSGAGHKFTEELERQVEAIVADSSWRVKSGDATPVRHVDLIATYLDHLRAVVPESAALFGFRLGVDCANGATSTVAPQLFASLGLQTKVIGDQPDGRNINLECGSTHPRKLSQLVIAEDCQLGVAFDGDGDRAIFVDHLGREVDGDAVLLMCARHLKSEGRLRGDAIVATVMSNIGLELGLKPLGIDLVRCAVGDKNVMEEMLKRGLSLGGEQSGHIIFSDYLFTGDGLCTALNVLRIVALTGRTLADLASDLTKYPQILLNVEVRERVDLQTVPAIAATIARVEEQVAGHGRLLVRYSGTERVLRVMLEGSDQEEIRRLAQEIVDVVREHLAPAPSTQHPAPST
jgi:phosphoglucosamine mutase